MRKLIVVILASALPFSILGFSRAENELLPFTTDGCSKSPDANWVHCCIDHDVAYWQGGTEEQRLQADLELKSCIADVAGKTIAATYYGGVRIGGGPGSKASYRWGYGWKYLRDYGVLSLSEQEQVEELFPENHREYPITRPERTLESTPSKSGDYCLDEVIHYLDENIPEEQKPYIIEKVTIVTKRSNSPNRKKRNYHVKLAGCEQRYIFKFGKATIHNCKSMRAIYLTKKYLKSVKEPQACY